MISYITDLLSPSVDELPIFTVMVCQDTLKLIVSVHVSHHVSHHVTNCRSGLPRVLVSYVKHWE